MHERIQWNTVMEANQLVADMASHDLYLIKCVVVGDTSVGKTRLICSRACGTRYQLSQLMQTHVPTVWAIDQYRKNPVALQKSWCTVDGVTVSVRLWDTFGDHNKDRRFAFGRADVILLCFSVVQPRSLRNVIHHWYPEIQQLCPGVPIILCGCQVDLRYLCKDPEFIKMDKGPFFREITDKDILLPEAGRIIAKQIGAFYYETSVCEPFGVDTVFVNASRAALVYKRERHFWTALGVLKNISQPHFQKPHLPPKPVPNVAPREKTPFCLNFDSIFGREAFCDVVFLVRNVPIKAHKVCLVASSSVFGKLFSVEETDDSSLISQIDECNGRSSETLTDTTLLLDSGDTTSSSGENVFSTSSDTDSVSHELFSPVFINVEIQPQEGADASASQMTIVTVDDRVSPAVFRTILDYLYSGRIPQNEDLLPEILWISRSIGLEELAVGVMNIMNKVDFMNLEIVTRFFSQRSARLINLIMKNGLFSDVTFELDDGLLKAHHVLLMAKSEVMSSMFSCEFKEKSAKVVTFPGVTTDVFKVLQEFLYTGCPPDFSSVNCLALIELANRLCQLELLSLTEEYVVSELNAMDINYQDIAEEVVMLLEPAQLHNATYLYNWCLWYIQVNYDMVYKRFSKLLYSLRPEIQIYLTNCRWPPVWYHRELDIYEKNVLDQQRQRSIRSCFPSGCLSCFSKEKNQKIQRKSV